MKLENKHIKKIVVILIVVLAFVFIKSFKEGMTNMSRAFKDLEGVKAYIRSFGKIAVVISFLMMILQLIVAPILAFFIASSNAAIWGWVRGSILSRTSAMAGATLCFGIARFLGRNIVEKFATKGALKKVEGFFNKYGKNAILVARLLLFVPFDPISYAAGLTPMGFQEFFVATGIGQLPATLIYSYAASKSANPSVWVRGLIILFGVFALGVLMKRIYNDKQAKKNI